MPDGERWAATPDETADWLAGRLDEEMRCVVDAKRKCTLNAPVERWQAVQAAWDDVYPRWVEYFRSVP